MKALIITFVMACSFIAASAQDADKVKELEQRVRQLEERMAMLEGRMAKTEGGSAANQQTPEAKKMQKVFLQHKEEERKNFKAADIQKAEELYIRASKLMREHGNPKTVLDSVVTMYPQLNRAGCAELYLAQQETGQEKERLLKDCIARFSTCYYGDGAQVGPLAMLQLASYYQQTGRDEDARKLFKRLGKESPDAVGHDGELLVEKID